MMTWLRKLGWLLTGRRKREELDEELAFHLEAEREDREALGESSDQARRHAALHFGNREVVREDTQSAWTWRLLEQGVQDLRYAFRMMRRSPAFTLMAVLSLALGIGVNTAVLGFMDVMLFRALPVKDPASLVRMRWHTPKNEMHGTSRHASGFSDPAAGSTFGVLSYPALEMFQQHRELFSAVFAYQGTGLLTVGLGGRADSVNGEYVSGDYFSALGVAPKAGRFLDPRDDEFGASPAVVLSHGFSRSRFSTPAEAIGQTLTINTRPFTIVGVMPAAFFGTDPGKGVDVYVPLHSNVVIEESPADARALFRDPSTFWLEIMARRQPGVSLTRVQASIAPPFRQISDDLKASGRWHQAPSLEVVDGRDGIDGLRRQYTTPLFMLLALAGLILALACTNIANLLLARASARTREMAVRLSVGAGRARIFRQLVTESLVLSCLGGAGGVVVALWAQSWVNARLNTGPIPLGVAPSLNWQALALMLMLSVLTGLLFGVGPALQATRRQTMPSLKDGRSSSASSSWRAQSPRRLLLAAEMAITLVMLVAAGLFLRTLRNYQTIEPGFSSDHVLTLMVRADQAGLSDQETIDLSRRLREQFAALPGVQSVGLSAAVIIGDGRSFTPVQPVGRESRESSLIIQVGGGFFSTMQLPILSGRTISADDERPGSQPVAVIDETYATTYFGKNDPVGQYLIVPGDKPGLQFAVVGVARNVRIGSLTGRPEATVYFPFSAAVFGSVNNIVFELRTSGEPMSYANAARAVVRQANPSVPIVRMKTQDALIEATVSREALLARLCATFAVVALAIAVVGLYGTVLHDVSRRRSEIGIRMALGAQRGQVVWMVLRDVLVVVVIGLAAGIPAAASATRIAEALLFGVQRGDLPTTVIAMAVLVATALAAAFAPALGAARVSPTVALRSE